MNYRFDADFNVHDPAGHAHAFAIEQNSDFEHGHAAVRDGAYWIMVPGNKHLARTPPLGDFDLALRLGIVAPNINDPCPFHRFGFRVFFRYDPFLKQGYRLTGRLAGRRLELQLETVDARDETGAVAAGAADLPPAFEASDFSASLSARGSQFVFSTAGVTVELEDARRTFEGRGRVGLDKAFFPGELAVFGLSLLSDDPPPCRAVVGPVAVELPCVHGMSVPYRYTLTLFRHEDGTCELDTELAGGIRDRPGRGPCGKQWTHEIDRLRDPYVRLLSPGGDGPALVLHHGLLTLRDREEKRDWIVAREADLAWPLRRRFYLDGLPADPGLLRFAAGYASFENDPQRLLAGGPYEAVADARGRRLYQGTPVHGDRVAVAVRSPADKRLVARIPREIPDRERALRHARQNHYFLEGEPLWFTVAARYRTERYEPGEFALSAELQSVFGDPLPFPVRLSPAAAESALKESLGIVGLEWEASVEGLPGPGVYHLAVKLAVGPAVLHEAIEIFEVLPDRADAVPPPVSSGLPLLFSIPNEIKYLETDAFDPRVESAGAMHYFGMCSYYPEYGRQRRIWELLQLYRRKWFLSISERTPSRDLSIAQNADIIARCDFLQIPLENKPRHGRNDLWMFDNYRGAVLEALIDFVRTDPARFDKLAGLSPAELEAIRAASGCLSESAFEALVMEAWQDWLAFFAARLAEGLKRQHDQLNAINQRVGRTSGGPYSAYVAHNKSAYFARYFGYSRRAGSAALYDGFWQFEDYPHSCAYSMTRATFGLMTLKQHFPEWRIFPEIYHTRLLDGCNDGAVSQAHPPFGFYDLPAALIRIRVYEFALATAWFRDKQFHYWRDYGFHVRAPGRAVLRELISGWGRVVKHPPERPVRATAFLVDLDLIAAHPEHYERHCNATARWKDVFNPAEEALAYTYTRAREAGLPAGFAVDLESLGGLEPGDLDLLVLPPLPRDLAPAALETIRALHRRGVSLMGFETVHGLENLFGVKPLDRAVRLRSVGAGPDAPPEVSACPAEYAEHELCVARYAVQDGETWLAGAREPRGAMEVPVLVTRRTAWGQTAFFNIPPTVVKRDAFIERIGFGQECLSALVKAASEAVLGRLSSPCVSVPGAKVIAFRDRQGRLAVIAEEETLSGYDDGDRYPRSLRLALAMPGIRSGDIRGDKPYSVASEEPGRLVLRFELGKYESAFFTVG